MGGGEPNVGPTWTWTSLVNWSMVDATQLIDSSWYIHGLIYVTWMDESSLEGIVTLHFTVVHWFCLSGLYAAS